MYNIKPGHIFGNLELDILVLNTFSKWNIHFREKRECNAILLFRRALVQNISNFVPTILAMYHIYCIKFPFLLIVVANLQDDKFCLLCKNCLLFTCIPFLVHFISYVVYFYTNFQIRTVARVNAVVHCDHLTFRSPTTIKGK